MSMYCTEGVRPRVEAGVEIAFGQNWELMPEYKTTSPEPLEMLTTLL